MEKNRLGRVLDSFCDEHFGYVIREIKNKFKLFLFRMNTIEVVQIQPELVAISDDKDHSSDWAMAQNSN